LTINKPKEKGIKFMNRLRLRAEGGFTLIELLVVIAIIGILAAIAIPQFAAYRRRSFESQSKSDLRNMATAQEAYFVNANSYKTCAAPCASGGGLTGWNSTTHVNVGAVGTTGAFTLSATHDNCTGVTNSWTYSSINGTIAGGPCD
jgi:type IV pilus assembly protein PilA